MSFDVMEEGTPCDYCGQPIGFMDDDWAVCAGCRTEYINMIFEGGDLESESPLAYWFIHFDRKVKTMSPFVYFMWIVWICILAVIAFVLFIPIFVFSLLAVPILLIGVLTLWLRTSQNASYISCSKLMSLPPIWVQPNETKVLHSQQRVRYTTHIAKPLKDKLNEHK